MKVVALHCNFLFSPPTLFVFCIFPCKNNTKQYHLNTFTKLREVATTIVLWENWPKMEGAYPTKEVDTESTKEC